MHHVLDPSRPHLHGRLSARATPVLTIESGDMIACSVPDVGWGVEPPTSTTAQRRKIEPRDDGPCLLGPIAVRGAEAGDTLEVAIESFRPGPWGWTYAGGGVTPAALAASIGLADADLTLLRWSIDIERGIATDDRGRVVPLRPFPGTIGLAPAADDACAWTPRACGGNMDCAALTAGSRLFLPVMVRGALLSLGDGHAAQGDGEVAGTAIECAIDELRLRVVLHRREEGSSPPRGPRVRTHDAWLALGFGSSLDHAAAMAIAGMLDLLEEVIGGSRAELAALATSLVDLRITQLVNPHRGVHAVLTDDALRRMRLG